MTVVENGWEGDQSVDAAGCGPGDARMVRLNLLPEA